MKKRAKKAAKKRAPTPRLTPRHLRALGACESQVEKFREVFPNGAPVTMASIRKAHRTGLGVSLWWLMDSIFPWTQAGDDAFDEFSIAASRDEDRAIVDHLPIAMRMRRWRTT